MILQNLAFKKGTKAAGHNLQSWSKHKSLFDECQEVGRRFIATNEISNRQLRNEITREHVKELSEMQKAKKDARALDKDFFISVLGSSATKREAKSYIQRFTPSKAESPPIQSTSRTKLTTYPIPGNGVNLGGFYIPAAVQESPKFVQQFNNQTTAAPESQLHVALVKVRSPQILDDKTLRGIGRTLSQLSRLGLISVVVVDCNEKNGPQTSEDEDSNWRSLETEQANRMVAAIDANGASGARLVDNIIGICEDFPNQGCTQPKTRVTLRKLLMTPLRKGVIPVIPSVGYTDTSQTAARVPASEVITALVNELAGFAGTISTDADEDPHIIRQCHRNLRDEVSLDRLIVLDPLGGIPSTDQENGYHVFLNMEQEYEPTKGDLLKSLSDDKASTIFGAHEVYDHDSRNQNSRLVGINSVSSQIQGKYSRNPRKSNQEGNGNWNHLQNLQLARHVLAVLPPSSSALLTTPEEAANSGKELPLQAARVGTRRQRNPLIHNLLTDRPAFSSSLPIGRLGGQPVRIDDATSRENITPTTFAKHGMSVTIFPDPKLSSWEPPTPGKPQLTLTASQIDLPRLVHLIEDSFGRKLDVQDYLKRVDGRVAGVIIAGEYEGGALLTWEVPPGVADDGSRESRARMVPYLDKFAVLKKKQGSATADIVFKAMVRDCFPQGLCWRSRKDNVVNKWYFERSRGTWKLPETGWTMFWTTPDLSLDTQTFLDYEGVCRGIEPSWADNKALLD